MDTFEWTKETYEASVSSRCWWYTPYDEGWDRGKLSTDNELREIAAMERELGSVPEWAQGIVERSINGVPPCGHYLFPLPHLEAVSAIGAQRPPDFVHGCFAVERERKRQMMDYGLCLDAWLAGAPPEAPARELMALGYRKMDWQEVCTGLWEVLGEHTEVKDLQVERLLHRLRHAIKECVWDDDLAADFGRDQYVGTICEDGEGRNPAKLYSYIEARVPGFNEKASPRVQRLEARLAQLPDKPPLDLGEWWLCAPKAFRFLERILWTCGKGGPPQEDEGVPGFLQCEDTYPNHEEATKWWKSFCAALDGWWRERPERGAVAAEVHRRLGESTPVKRWLVRLFLCKLKRLEENGEQLTNLVRPQHGHRRGTRALL